MKRGIASIGSLGLLFIALAAKPQTIVGGYKPADGFVPDEKTAIRVAEAVLMPVYGENHIIDQRPFHGRLAEGVWTISGTLHCPTEPYCVGGTAVVKISKKTGEILDMIHFK
jgi:hypothetical protein